MSNASSHSEPAPQPPTAEQTAERRHKELIRAINGVAEAIERNTLGLEYVGSIIASNL